MRNKFTDKLYLKSTGGGQKVNKHASRANIRWKLLRQHVLFSGRYCKPYKRFLAELQTTCQTIGRQSSVRRSKAAQYADLSDLNIKELLPVSTLKRRPETLDKAKSSEAYRLAMRCAVYPLLDHSNLSLESLVSEPAKHTSLAQKLMASISATLNNVGKFGDSSVLTDSQKCGLVDSIVLKELSKLIGRCLKAEHSTMIRKGGVSIDEVYCEALAGFQREVFFSRQLAAICSNGLTFEDLLNIMERNLEHETMVNGKLADKVGLQTRLERFADLLKDAVNNAFTVKQLKERKAQKNRNQKSHGRVQSSPEQSVSAFENEQQTAEQQTAVQTIGEKHGRSKTSPDTAIAKYGTELITVEQDYQSFHTSLTEFLQRVFQIDRSTHQRVLAELQSNSELKVVENRMRQFLDRGQAEGEFPRRLDEVKMQQKAAEFYIKRIDALYMHNDTEKNSVVSDRNKRYVLTVRIVEARNLALKHGRRANSAFAVVEHGRKQRYETEVANESCKPFWDQSSNLTVRASSRKSIKISVWDKSIEDDISTSISPLSRRFWMDESDDFLGQVSFNVRWLLEELQKSPSVDRWFSLQKRSKRSNISGEIRLQFHAIEFDPEKSGIDFIGSMDQLESADASFSKELIHFATEKDAYVFVMKRIVQSAGLTDESFALLDEFGEHYLLRPVWRHLVLTEYLVERCLNGEIIEIYQLDAAVSKLTQMVQESRCVDRFECDSNWFKGNRVILLADEEFNSYRTLIEALANFQMGQVSRYKECFPLNTPNGALVVTLNMLNTFYFDNSLIDRPGGKSRSECLGRLIIAGTMERYLRLDGMAAPMINNAVKKLVNLSRLVGEELDLDTKYFSLPFAADLDLINLTASVYLKNLMLEISQVSKSFTTAAASCGVGHQTADFTDIFDLFFACHSIEEKYLDKLTRNAENEKIIQEFSIHAWIAPCIKRWMAESETKLIEWVAGAVNVDSFQPISIADNAPYSTSVVDMFTCFNQIYACLNKLDWESGTEGLADSLRKERKKQWLQLLTYFSRLITRGLSKYCSLFLDELSLSSLTITGDSDSEKAFKPTLFPVRKACTQLNNYEKARELLNELFDTINVEKWREFEETTATETAVPAARLSGVSGYLTTTVVLAENLKACDSNGLSDPYCLVDALLVHLQADAEVPKKVSPGKLTRIGRTRIIPKSLNPKWNETFSWFLQGATDLNLTVMDWDRLNPDEQCARGTIRLNEKLADGQTHDIWLEMEPQGRVLVRVQIEKANSAGDLASIDYYFRKCFRLIKSTAGDTLGILASAIGANLRSDLIQIVLDAEKSGEQGQGASHGWLKLGKHKNRQMDESDSGNLVSFFDVEKAAAVLTSRVDQQLAIVSGAVYEKVCKEFLRYAWKEFLSDCEALLVPNLYGEGSLLPLLRRNKPLTERQVELLWKTIELMKQFFHADGSGLPIKQLETTKYCSLRLIAGMYWCTLDMLSSNYRNIINAEQHCGVQSDCLLRLARIRGERDKQFAEFFKYKLKERSARNGPNY